MDKELRDKWVEALRSGKYKQGKAKLAEKNTDGSFSYCCLGVLCDVANLKYIVDKASGTNGIIEAKAYYINDERHRSFAFLPLDPRFQNIWENVMSCDSMEQHLITMNDEGSTFEEIADWIEKNVVH